MTTLVAWVGVDSRIPASLYFASDSRMTWPGSGLWDYGRKLFAAQSQPHLLGYCGDVLFPTQVLGQIVEIIDRGLLFAPGTASDRCFDQILNILTKSLVSYPALAQDFQILYGMREGEVMECSFHLYQATFQKCRVTDVLSLPVPSHSDVIAVLGSGQEAFRYSLERWKKSEVGRTSRSVFSALADALNEGVDPKSGGPPQLVGLYRKGGGRTFGVIWKGKRYFYGTDITNSLPAETVKWHNERFEICDPQTLLRDPRSQAQPQPRGLEKTKK